MANWKEITPYANMEDTKPAPEGFVKIPERKQILSSVLEEHDLVAAQRTKRKELLEALEAKLRREPSVLTFRFFVPTRHRWTAATCRRSATFWRRSEMLTS
jgi:hypothetical protein